MSARFLALAIFLIFFPGIAGCTIADMFIATAHVMESLGETATDATVAAITTTAEAVESTGKNFDYVANPVNSAISALGEYYPDPIAVGETVTDALATTAEALKSVGKSFDYVANPVNSAISALGEAETDATTDLLVSTAEVVDSFVEIPASYIITPFGEKPEVYDGGEPWRMNLVLGGIRQTKGGNEDLKDFADNNSAIYIPTYNSYGDNLEVDEDDPTFIIKGLLNFAKAALDGLDVQGTYSGLSNYKNGLANTELQGQKYETIIAYSGGTATAVAAILMQDVRCENLILISPMDAAMSADDYAYIIDAILAAGYVNHIQIIWSPEDHPTSEGLNFYQAKASTFVESDKVSIKQVDLSDSKSGWDAHGDILEYAIANIHGGEFVDPDTAAAKETAIENEKNAHIQFSGSDLPDEPYTRNVLEVTKQSEQSETQESQQSVQKKAQYSEPSTSQSSSSGTFDAYSEGKKIVEEFFASGKAEVALQEGLLSNTEGSDESTGETSSEESNLAGINFTSIKLNSISVTTDSLGGVNFDLILKAEKAEGSKPGISIQNATRIGATAFLTGLDVPDYKFWVNLNPWEVDRIIDEELEQSEVGRIMLEADLQMKKDFSNYGSPCVNKTGKALWSLLDKKREALVQQCMSKFPGQIYNTDNINFKSVTTHWIVPDKVYVYSNGTQISIINASLSINSESDKNRSSFQVSNQDLNTLSRGCTEELNRSAQEYGEYCENLEENMIQPCVVADINSKEKYEDLRDVYTALALAQWYKSNISPLADIFRYSRGSSSFSASMPETTWSPKDIWDKYVYSFKNGEYICWENSTTKSEGRTLTRSHRITTGGVEFDDIGDHLVTNEAMPPEVQDQAKKAIADGIVDSQNDVLFGYRFHVDQKKGNQITSTSLRSQDLSQGANDSLKEDRTISEASLTNKEAQIQSKDIPSVGKVEGNTSLATCPEGWMGPDEDGKCWQIQITGIE